MRSVPGLRISVAATACLLTSLAPAPALADVSSWAYAGFGPGFLDSGQDDRNRWTLELATGLGTAPAALVFGGMFRVQPYFGEGTDLALLLRAATRGFVQGDWGVALDAGGYERFWGEGSEGGLASVVLGGPWGLTLSATGGLGTHNHRFASATLGLDFARLTVHRLSGKSWFLNPFVTDERGRGPR